MLSLWDQYTILNVSCGQRLGHELIGGSGVSHDLHADLVIGFLSDHPGGYVEPSTRVGAIRIKGGHLAIPSQRFKLQ